MKEVQGDLIKRALAGQFDVIVHGCNCFCTMGAGIARQIKTKFPEAFQADQRTVKGSRDKLGKISYATVNLKNNKTLAVVNAYTQYRWGGSERNVNYDSLRKAFNQIKVLWSGKRIGYPKIGAGLAGGDWDIISNIIKEELEDEDHTLVLYKV